MTVLVSYASITKYIQCTEPKAKNCDDSSGRALAAGKAAAEETIQSSSQAVLEKKDIHCQLWRERES